MKQLKYSSLLILCLVLYNVGPNYHFSFGSIGLLYLIYLSRNHINLKAILNIFIGSSLIITAYIVYIYNYGGGYTLQIMRMAFNASALLFLLKVNTEISIPSKNLILIAVLLVVLPIYYQFFLDPYFRLPSYILAMADIDTEYLVNLSSYNLDFNPRPVSLYIEPSSAGMVLACLAIFRPYLTKYRLFMADFLILSATFMISSFLGYISVFTVYLYYFYQKTPSDIRKFTLIPIIFFSALFIYFTIIERSSVTGVDSSTLVRVVYPFIIIYSNIENYDWFGIPFNMVEHFRYLNIYDGFSNFPGHNGILSLIINFGLSGIFILYILFKSLRSFLEFFIIVVIFSQNGNFLSYEKIFIAIYMLYVIRKININKT